MNIKSKQGKLVICDDMDSTWTEQQKTTLRALEFIEDFFGLSGKEEESHDKSRSQRC